MLYTVHAHVSVYVALKVDCYHFQKFVFIIITRLLTGLHVHVYCDYMSRVLCMLIF